MLRLMRIVEATARALIRWGVWAGLLVLILFARAATRANAGQTLPSGFNRDPLLDAGFQAMYAHQFAKAEGIFADYQRAYPNDSFAYAAQSAALLFHELDRLDLLEAEFYEDEDEKSFAKSRGKPDAQVRETIFRLTDRAVQMSQARLDKNSGDEDALYSMMLAKGVQADYNALVDRHYWAALRLGSQGESWAHKLLKADPEAYDAYLFIGIPEYVVGTLPAPVRWLVHLAGFGGSRKEGIEDLERTMNQGHYLRSYAKVVLVLVHLREHDRPMASKLMDELHAEYPDNPMFAKQAARLHQGVK